MIVDLVQTKTGLHLPLRSCNKGLGRDQGWQEHREPAVIFHWPWGMHRALLSGRLACIYLCLETLVTLRGQEAVSENTQQRMKKENDKPSGLGTVHMRAGQRGPPPQGPKLSCAETSRWPKQKGKYVKLSGFQRRAANASCAAQLVHGFIERPECLELGASITGLRVLSTRQGLHPTRGAARASGGGADWPSLGSCQTLSPREAQWLGVLWAAHRPQNCSLLQTLLMKSIWDLLNSCPFTQHLTGMGDALSEESLNPSDLR